MKSKWVAIILTASVALNLALAGFVLGSHNPQGRGFDPTRVFPRWAQSLPEPRRADLDPVMTKHRQAMRPMVRTLRRQHRALQAALTAEPFDEAALQAALAEMRAEHERVQQASHDAFAEFVVQLTPAERQALVQDMGKRRRQGPRRPHGPGARPEFGPTEPGPDPTRG